MKKCLWVKAGEKMALSMIEQIREAELQAEQVEQDAKERADRILREAAEKAGALQKEAAAQAAKSCFI